MEATLFIISILDKGRNNWHYCVNFYKDYMYMCEIVYSVSSDSSKAIFYYFLIRFIFTHYHHFSITVIYQISIAMGRG